MNKWNIAGIAIAVSTWLYSDFNVIFGLTNCAKPEQLSMLQMADCHADIWRDLAYGLISWLIATGVLGWLYGKMVR